MWLETIQVLLPFLSHLVGEHINKHGDNFASRPRVAPQFVSSISVNTPSFQGAGRFEFDLPNQRLNQTINSPWFGGYSLNTSAILLNTSAHNFINGRCAEINGTVFGDPFGWLVLAKFSGTVTLGPEYHSRTCNFWNFSVPTENVSLALCLESNDTIPVLWTIEEQGLLEFLYFYQDFSPIQPPAEDFILPKNCFEKAPLCAGGAVVEVDSFVFHPQNQFDLINEDVADLLGDTVFICVDFNNTGFDHYAWVSRYTLQMWSGWGEYALCNRPSPNETGVCVGKETFSVGREAAYGIKDQCGQCTNNDDVGNWYSLPTAGLCNSDSQPLGPDASKGQCSWRVLKRLKTIDGVCLLKTNGMASSCSQEFDYPFAQSRAILLQSFESDDPSQGGCPPIA
jgi:hypothetical protein